MNYENLIKPITWEVVFLAVMAMKLRLGKTLGKENFVFWWNECTEVVNLLNLWISDWETLL